MEFGDLDNGVWRLGLLEKRNLEVAALDSNAFLKLPDVFTQKSIPVTHGNIPKVKDGRHAAPPAGHALPRTPPPEQVGDL